MPDRNSVRTAGIRVRLHCVVIHPVKCGLNHTAETWRTITGDFKSLSRIQKWELRPGPDWCATFVKFCISGCCNVCFVDLAQSQYATHVTIGIQAVVETLKIACQNQW